ncbi:MAG TPA: FliM/FliN family flagellar motor switch protein [Pyrinomonadaceae bacterium]|jgi:flagellar motor switch/type III secretory pathway protein FliN
MKTDANTLREEGGEPAPAVDPFAVDLFAGGPAATAADARALPAAAARAVPWDAALPKVSRDEARLSSMLAAVPASLSTAALAALARVAGRFTRTDADGVAFDVLETREEEIPPADSPRAYVRVAVEPWEARAVLAVESSFASAVVDLMLGGEGVGSADTARSLSTAERAVFEFLCAQLLAALNEEAGEPLFRLEALTEDAGAGVGARAVVTKVRARFGRAAGVVRLVYGAEVLAALDEMRSPLLARAGGVEKLARCRAFCAGANVSLLVGETEVDPASLAGLEPGDVVLVERVFGEWGPGAARGTLRARVGAGDNVLVSGAAGRGDGAEGSDGAALRLLVEEVSASEARGAEAGGRLRMEDEGELATGSDEEAGLLDNLLLTVRVELPARRISLEELTRLRAGQILELDCRATDPVELVADGRRVATGELVDIEGRLGVRVTRLAG